MPLPSRGITLPTISQCVVLSLICFGCWLAWGEFAAFQERQGLWNPEATATERIRAADAWSEQGEQAVPDLIRALNDAQPQTRRYAAVALAQLETRGRGAVPQLRDRLHDPHPLVRGQVVATLPVVDPQSAESIDAVADLLTDPDRKVRQEAAAALRTWGAQAEPAIVARLQHPLPEVRQIAIELIPRTPGSRRAVLPALRDLADDSSEGVRVAAICVLIDAGEASLSDLVKWLQPENDRICSAAIPALRRFGGEAALAVPKLIECLERAHPRIQGLVVETLRAIGPPARASLPALLSHIERAGERNVIAPLHAIESIGGPAEILTGPLDTLTVHPNPGVAGTALRLLSRLDSARARVRIERLISVLGESDPFEIRTACSVIAHVGATAKGALPNLQLLMNSGDRQICHFALLAIRSLGPAAAPAVPSIVSLLKQSEDEDLALFDALVETVIAIGAEARPAADVILEQLHRSSGSGDEWTHAQIHRQARLIVAAARIGISTPEFRQILHTNLEFGRSVVQVAALEALALLGSSDAPEWDMILDSLDADDPATRLAAIHAIPMAIGAEPGAADALARCLADPEPRIRVAAARALGQMGGSAETALPALRSASHDSENEGPALRFVPMHYRPSMAAGEARPDDPLPPGATVSDVIQDAIREIEGTTSSFSQ